MQSTKLISFGSHILGDALLISIHMLLTNAKGEKNREGGRAREGEAQEEEMNKRTEVVLLNKCITNHDSNVLNNEVKSMGKMTPCTDMYCTHTDQVLATP
jgi:hypothetical protein